MRFQRLYPLTVLAVFLAAAAARAEARTAPADTTRRGGKPDSAAAAARRDSALARVDSGLILGKKLATGDYLSQREHFSYPQTSREDPFNFPMAKNAKNDVLGPSISDLLLTGVLYTADGPRIAILTSPSGDSFLLREGDMLGVAELSLIEPTNITFRIREFGQVREFFLELKPLAEEKDGKSPEAAGGVIRQEETQEKSDESGGAPPAGH